MDTQQAIPEHPELIDRAEVLRRTRLSRAKLYELIACGDFPAPVALGARVRVWPLHEISAWIHERISAERDTPSFGTTAEEFQTASRASAG